MSERTTFTPEEARQVGEQIGIGWADAPFDVVVVEAREDVVAARAARALLS